MFCKDCGAQIPDDALFCSDCGTKIEQPQAINNTTPKENNNPTPNVIDHSFNQQFSGNLKPKNKDNTVIIVSLCVLAVIIIGAIFAIVFINKNKADVPATTIQTTTATTTQVATQSTTQAVTQAPITTNPESYAYGRTMTDTQLEALVRQGNMRYYTDDELSRCSAYELVILRNGLYAISGKIFTENPSVIDFFNSCYWYSPYTTDANAVKSTWNNYQVKNLEKILKYE